MKVIAVDPGFGRCGIAVLAGDSQNAEVLFSTCIETPAKSEFVKRLYAVIEEVITAINTYHPDLFVIEGLFFSNNQKTALQVAEVRGALLYVATKNNLPIQELHPGAAKIALTGYGSATKNQMMFMVQKLVKLPEGKRLDDEFDALALGLAALAESEVRERLKKYNE